MHATDELTDFDWLSDLAPLLAAQAAWHDGSYDRPVWYHLRYRPNGPFLLSCGADLLADLARRFRFTFELIRRLGAQRDEHNRALFTESFLNYLQRLRIRTDVWAAPEGALLLPDEPLAAVRGPKAHVLLLTAPMHWLLWHSTHWATLAAQQRWPSGSLTEEDTPPTPRASLPPPTAWASRAAYIGGAEPDAIKALLHPPAPTIGKDEGFQTALVTYPTAQGDAKPLVQIRRTYRGGHPQGDIWLTRPHEEVASVSKTSAQILDVRTHRQRTLHFNRFQNLYQLVLLRGYPVLKGPNLPYLRQRTLVNLRAFSPEKLAEYPHGWFADASP